MIKLISILNELGIRDPLRPSKEEAIQLAIEFVKEFSKTEYIDWESQNTTYSEDLNEVNPRLIKYLENLGFDEDYDDLHNDLRFDMIDDENEGHHIAIYLNDSNEIEFEPMGNF